MDSPRLPRRIYLDTSFVIASLIAGLAHSEPCAAFCEQLADRRSVVYFSYLLRLEIAQALKNVATRPRQLPESLRLQFRLAQWATESAVRRRWMRFGFSQFDSLMATFQDVREIPLSLAACMQSRRIMSDYDLKSYDALHIATVRELRLRDFAATDREFRTVSGLKLWLIRDPP